MMIVYTVGERNEYTVFVDVSIRYGKPHGELRGCNPCMPPSYSTKDLEDKGVAEFKKQVRMMNA